jgi:hypothetical protein
VTGEGSGNAGAIFCPDAPDAASFRVARIPTEKSRETGCGRPTKVITGRDFGSSIPFVIVEPFC